MILIRGIKGKQYAEKIKKGIVDCRDILSAILSPPHTGYKFSDYYEKNFVKALKLIWPDRSVNLCDPTFLYSLLVDYYVPYIYVTYFHILNDDSLKWLNNFDNEYSFIGMNVNLDKITRTVIGNDYFGAPLKYVDSIGEVEQTGINYNRLACSVAVENVLSGCGNFEHALNIYNTLTFPLLCREREGKYSEIENEFRIVAFDCPKFINNSFITKQRDSIIRGESGVEYFGVLKPTDFVHQFKSNCFALRNPIEPLSDILVREQGKITINSTFKEIDIMEIADDFYYIGDKEKCADYIKRMNSQPQTEKCAEYIVQRTHDISEIKKSIKGYWEVEYLNY